MLSGRPCESADGGGSFGDRLRSGVVHDLAAPAGLWASRFSRAKSAPCASWVGGFRALERMDLLAESLRNGCPGCMVIGKTRCARQPSMEMGLGPAAGCRAMGAGLAKRRGAFGGLPVRS